MIKYTSTWPTILRSTISLSKLTGKDIAHARKYSNTKKLGGSFDVYIRHVSRAETDPNL